MKPEKRFLIHDLLDDEERDARREATLLAGGRVLRRRRWKRVAIRSLAMGAVVTAAVLFVQKMTSPRPSAFTTVTVPQPQVHYLTDEELLGLFPNTPVGLATMVDGKKRLIFPRPGDEERFVTRL